MKSKKHSKREIRGRLCLDLGCGENLQKGFVGVDSRPLSNVDIVCDLESFPWPIESASATIILCSHLIEHIKPWLQLNFMNECWRVLEKDGVVLISTPYGGSFRYNQDPTHCSPWNEATPAYFVKGTELYNVYKPKPWKLQKCSYFIQGDLEVVLVKMEEDEDGVNSPRKE